MSPGARPPQAIPSEAIAALGADATAWRMGARVAVWQRHTGRAALLSEQALVAPSEGVRRRLRQLHLIGPSPDLALMRPCRSRWTTLYPEQRQLWHPLPMRRGPGGFPFAAMDISEGELRAWREMNGARSLLDVAARAGLSERAITAFMGRLTAIEVQAAQLRDAPPSPRDPSLQTLVAPPRPANVRAEHQYGEEAQTSLERWHVEDIHDGATHFDDRETTLAHAFAVPHPALSGQPYGARLADRLAARGLLPPPGGVVLEIGPGTGELCAALREALDRPLRYLRLDLSPALLATQAARCPGTEGLQGSATDIPLPKESVDLVLSNEVIADLEAHPSPGEAPVSPEPGQALFNTGAWRMMEELSRVLRPGGGYFVSEFGGARELPLETTQLDHPEVSVHFGQLLERARAAGLGGELHAVADWMGFDTQTRWLSRASYEGLRARHRAEGLTLEARAWTLAQLKLPWPVEGLFEVPIHEDGPGPVLSRFMCLVGRKPER